MDKKELKKYFIKDASLYGVDDDMFNYADISKVLNKIIETNEPPYNIAIIGKWGLGKSSLINLVTNKYKNKNEYVFQDINAWKYEKESLGKVFLKQLWQGISEQKFKSFQVIQREFSEIINGDFTTTSAKSIKKKNTKLLRTIGIFTFATIIAFVLYKLIQAGVLNIEVNTIFWGNVFLSYCKNIATVLLLPVLIGLSKTLLDEYRTKETKKIELSFPLESADDYEIFLETKIQERLSEFPDLKVITVIDDLDRLSINKIVEALDALKTFVGFKRCVFIVPFDDEIIKLALEKRRIQQFDDSNDIIESELILDKLFQYKIYLPPLLKFDIRQYATDLVKEEIPDFLSDYCQFEIMEKLLNRIIIHSDVTTPRQVKKLINSFVNNYMVACEREHSEKVQAGLFSSELGQQQIAKFSVLQADFNQFYDLIFKDFSFLEKLLFCHHNELPIGEIPNELQEYFTYTDEKKADIKPEHLPLINFLTRTSKYSVSNISPYLYLAQDEFSKTAGDEVHYRALSALESGNTNTLQTMLKENPSLAEGISYFLSISNDDLTDAISTSISLFSDVEEAYQKNLAHSIIDRTLEMTAEQKKFLYTVSSEMVFAVAQNVDTPNFRSDFLKSYLSCLANPSWVEPTAIISALGVIIPLIDDLDAEAQIIVKSISQLCISTEDVTVDNLCSIVETDNINIFNKLWGKAWFDKLCKYIETENDFSNEIVVALEKSFCLLTSTIPLSSLLQSLSPLVGFGVLLPTLNSILTKELCAKIPEKNVLKLLILLSRLTTSNSILQFTYCYPS